MKNFFNNILLLSAALSAFTVVQGAFDNCQGKELSNCATFHCDDHNEKNCVWNPAHSQCHCPHPDKSGCQNVPDGTNCDTATCINDDGFLINCGDRVKVPSLPGFLNPKNANCDCPIDSTCSDPSAETCDPTACGDVNLRCDKGFEGQSCSCRAKCGATCDCDLQNCVDGCICIQNVGKDGTITSKCETQTVNSPCDCNKEKCGLTELLCIAIKPENEPACGVCKVALGDCCDKTSECAEGFCTEDGRCKLPCGAHCDTDDDQCAHIDGLWCKTTEGFSTCQKIEEE